MNDFNFFPEKETKRRFNFRFRRPSLVTIVLVLIIIVVIEIFVYLVFFKPEILGLERRGAQTEQSDEELEQLISEVGQFYLLPNEVPVLATVNDLSQVADQEFFKNAQNGDKILIFQNAKKAVLYRPSAKMIIEIGFVRNEASDQFSGADTPATQFFPEPELVPAEDIPEEQPVIPDDEITSENSDDTLPAGASE